MTRADFESLSADEKKHFYECVRCGEMVDKRKLDEVLFHNTGHKPRPDIQYGGFRRRSQRKWVIPAQYDEPKTPSDAAPTMRRATEP